tara:strand:- start:3728 stop:4207 length:480 start_codon:yes stop_codon:yes gene_type:complete
MPIGTKSSKINISKEIDTKLISKIISNHLVNGDIVFLYGEIGVGKTTFVKYLINFLQKKNKEKTTEVPSPTFNVVNEYLIKKQKFIHYDLYRIKDETELNNIGLFEDSKNCISFVEWPEVIKRKPKNRIDLYFNYEKNFKKRNLIISTDYKKKIFNEFK